MTNDNLDELISEIQVPIGHPQFYSRVFTLLATKRRQASSKDGDNLKRVCVEEYDDWSRRLDRTNIQESASMRNVLRTRRLASLLIDDKGEINTALLPAVINYFTANLYSIGPNRQFDGMRQEHILKVLGLLQNDKNLLRQLKNISKPVSHYLADEIIRNTLQLEPNTPLTDAHARRAALAAWMCYLRQNVGSCFATAPAIIVHDEQPEQFLKDLNELLGTGRLKRTFGGIEYTVPISSSWGAGDLMKPFPLRSEQGKKIAEIWLSPSFISALESATLVANDITEKQKSEQAKNLVVSLISTWKDVSLNIITTMEEILQKILMTHHGITSKDLEEYKNRPSGIIQGAFLMQVTPTARGTKSKGSAAAAYLKDLEQAEKAFKATCDNALLKSWEFTLASFAETKSEFARWNLYSSLGLQHNEPGGIGQCLFAIIKDRLDAANQKVHDFQGDYEQAYAQVKFLEGRMKNASTEKEIQWLKAEYQVRSNEFYLMEEMRNKQHNRAKQFAGLYDTLISIYDSKFPEYFQEVYDADMHDVNVGPYDDSPAGFRLLYKHGRTNTAAWTMIYNYQEFIEALSSFFIATETSMRSDPDLEWLGDELSEIVTAVVSHIKSNEFIETAFHRMAAAHKTRPIADPLNNLDKIEKKPWAYTSGGNMSTLVSCYFRREQKPTEVQRWVENEIELLVFLIDSVKQIPYKITQEYLNNTVKSLLIHSPTHAFLLKPGLCKFKQGVAVESFTYTWVRDNFVTPMQRFVSDIEFNEEMIEYLLLQVKTLIPESLHHNFNKAFYRIPYNLSPKLFREFAVQEISHDKALRSVYSYLPFEDDLDSLIYSIIPLFPADQLQDKLNQIFANLTHASAELLEKLNVVTTAFTARHSAIRILNARDLLETAKALLGIALNATSLSFDCHSEISIAAQKLGFAMPAPIMFADTNWVKDQFGFTINPGTGKFELWRLDYTGRVGYPMSSWKQWVNGSRQDLTWGIYTRPQEYNA